MPTKSNENDVVFYAESGCGRYIGIGNRGLPY